MELSVIDLHEADAIELAVAEFASAASNGDLPTGKGRSQARRRSGREARPTESRQRERTQGAKAACEGRGYRDWDWHGPAHLKGASNEPARGPAMTSGPHLTNSL